MSGSIPRANSAQQSSSGWLLAEWLSSAIPDRVINEIPGQICRPQRTARIEDGVAAHGASDLRPIERVPLGPACADHRDIAAFQRGQRLIRVFDAAVEDRHRQFSRDGIVDRDVGTAITQLFDQRD